ncbi:alpha/beta hydrolase, partial [Helicobacter pylori]|nr:alpha/beta hydrolase [Helicobacter pylori]
LFVLEGDHFFFLNQAKEIEKLVENYHHAKS